MATIRGPFHNSVCRKVDWLFSDRRHPDELRFPHLAMIGMVETRVERGGEIERECRYDLASAKLDAKAFPAAVWAHGPIENRLDERACPIGRDRLIGETSRHFKALSMVSSQKREARFRTMLQVLDIVFHDDPARLRTGSGRQNMAVVEHMAVNLVRTQTDKHGMKVRRELANLNPDDLETLIKQTASKS